jgi:hypothetical protein
MQEILSTKMDNLEEVSETLADDVIKSQSFRDDFIPNYRQLREEYHFAGKKKELLLNSALK